MNNETRGSEHTDAVTFFTKWPESGHVKTRLARDIGQTKAAELYRQFVLDLTDTLFHLPCDTLCFYDPSAEVHLFEQWLGPQHRYIEQQGHDLGLRMAQAFTWAFHQNYDRVILIGTDSPDLPQGLLQQALDSLHTHDMVLGPSEDGGYYLIGFSKSGFSDTIFENIPWSTPQVYEKTCFQISRADRRVHTLPVWYDVDTQDDLTKLVRANQHVPSSLPRTMACLQQHGLFPKEFFS